MSRSFRRSPDLRVLPGARDSREASVRDSAPDLDGGSFTATARAAAELIAQEPGAAHGEALHEDVAALSRIGRTDQNPQGRADSNGVEDSDVRSRESRKQPRLEQLADAQLVALSRAGDRAAFESLYRRHAAFALNLAVRIQGRLDDVEDVVHDAFLRAHNQMDRLRDDAAFRGWLASIVVSLVRSRLRRVRLLKTLGLASAEPIDLDALAADNAGPETRALLAQVYGALRRMPVDQRIAWTLRYVERHSLPDVAAMTDCSLATAKRRIFAAQSMLNEVLGDTFVSEPTGEAGGALD
jgi:RNA polymerase sigma-70 factor (ECF subfamily)